MKRNHCPHFLIACFFTLLSGCATVQPPPPEAAAKPFNFFGLESLFGENYLDYEPPRTKTEISNIPFFENEDMQGSPAALATILAVEGFDITPEQLINKGYFSEHQASFFQDESQWRQADLTLAIRKHGLIPYPISAMDELHLAIQNDQPVLVLLNLHGFFFPKWQFAVVYGYSEGEYLLRSGEKNNSKIETLPASDFYSRWNDSDKWGLIAHRTTQPLQEFQRAEIWLGEAIALERESLDDALLAYSTGLSHWPEDARFAYALGNSFYKKDQLRLATNFLRRAVKLDPNFADAWNNLAQTYMKQDKKRKALEAIDKAIEIGGPHSSRYMENRDRFKTF